LPASSRTSIARVVGAVTKRRWAPIQAPSSRVIDAAIGGVSSAPLQVLVG
jgi:hypothetical protein